MSRDETLFGLLVGHHYLRDFVNLSISQGGIHPTQHELARQYADILASVICPPPNGKVVDSWWLTEAGEKCSFFFLWVWGAQSMSVWEFTDYLGDAAKAEGLALSLYSLRYLASVAMRQGDVFVWALPESFGKGKGVRGVRRRLFLRIEQAEAYAQSALSAIKEKKK